MKMMIVAVCLSLCVASQAFILNDGFQDYAMFRTIQGQNPFDFGSLFGGPSQTPTIPAANVAAAAGSQATGNQATAAAVPYQTSNAGLGNLNNLLGLGFIAGDFGFF